MLNKKTILLILIVVLQITIFSQAKITFEISTENLSKDEKVYLAGNHELLGVWNPGKVVLESKDNKLWKKTIKFPKNLNIEFKITRGSWETEGQLVSGVTPENFSFRTNKDTLISIKINDWKDKNPPIIIGQITGKVEYHNNLSSKGILPRNVIVWLPPGYDESSSKRFPVLYIYARRTKHYRPRNGCFWG